MTECEVIVMVSADAEWAAVRNLYPNATYSLSPFGEWFRHEATVNGKSIPVVFFQGGWGKISAAASTQHIIDQWHPALIINLGTCGGLKGHIEKGMFVVATDTVVYDIVEQMLDPTEAIDFYSTQLDLTWMQQPVADPEFRGLLLSADRDLIIDDIADLRAKYGAVAADWESGAIAWVAARNNVACAIVRGVTDLVGPDGGEAYDGHAGVFVENSKDVMHCLNEFLPNLLGQWLRSQKLQAAPPDASHAR